ncbi:DUF2946 domain-containing protein [Hydrocarboniclastica marina]|uniref:DUF2946 domain-containing protein n=2 Tax=Hydrocarboniclastica marina TaxID=2259620 RepID=A0A4P7XJL5_9ALTE|nr:DUF2946 domain-containing protein [Hydrocarboniclastica marina]
MVLLFVGPLANSVADALAASPQAVVDKLTAGPGQPSSHAHLTRADQRTAAQEPATLAHHDPGDVNVTECGYCTFLNHSSLTTSRAGLLLANDTTASLEVVLRIQARPDSGAIFPDALVRAPPA